MKTPIKKKVISQCNICMFNTGSCICQPSWKNFNDYFKKKFESSLHPTPLRISTITFGFKLHNTTIDLLKFSRKFKKTLFARSIEFKKNSKKSKKNIDVNYNFYNQCSVQCFIPHEKYKNQLVKLSIKIFHNGSFNITGARSIQGIVHTIREIIKYLLTYEDILVGPLCIRNTKISMINTDFSICKKIKQNVLNKILNEEKFSIQNGGCVKRSTFDPDSYHGVKIKYVHNICDKKTLTRKGVEKMDSELSILVFNTGNIIITGGKTAEETYGAYEFINSVFEEYKEAIVRKNSINDKKEKKRKIYLKSVEYQKLQEELNDEQKLNCKRNTYSLKGRALVEMVTSKHKNNFKKVLVELLERVNIGRLRT